ncbi:MAG: protoheme IX farnesyltransferase, partial [Nannocystaceae bacterium]
LLTAGLAAFAIASYVGVYTPLKYKTPAALIVGAVPGAIPPLLGWTAVTDAFDPPGLAVFAILLVWQIPHFIAISLFRAGEYEKAGIKVLPLVRGPLQAKLHAAAWSVGLIPISMSLTPLQLTGTLYFVVALGLGVAYFGYSLLGFRATAGDRWAKRFFFASLIYLPALTLALVADLSLQEVFRP